MSSTPTPCCAYYEGCEEDQVPINLLKRGGTYNQTGIMPDGLSARKSMSENSILFMFQTLIAQYRILISVPLWLYNLIVFRFKSVFTTHLRYTFVLAPLYHFIARDCRSILNL